MQRRQFVCLAATAAARTTAAPPDAAAATLTKVGDLVVYSDDRYYSSFPSAVRRSNGELMVAFRRAPNRRLIGERRYSHTDATSQLVLVRSRDAGRTWTREPELIYAHPWGGSQDPCLLALSDGTLLCASYLWTRRETDAAPGPASRPYGFQGGYLLRSADGGRSWQGPFYPPPVPGRPAVQDLFGKPLAAYNRGAMCQGRDGRIYWAVAYSKDGGVNATDVHLMISSDRGSTWSYSCPIATDAKAVFNETSLFETRRGDLVAFLRTAALDDHTVVARSTDGGRSFAPWQDAGWQGHPHQAARLDSGRVLLVYGYRHAPYGVRARLLNAECTDFATAPETVLRDDGGGGDLGYPWAVSLGGGRALVVYYMQHNDGIRYIGGTIVAETRSR